MAKTSEVDLLFPLAGQNRGGVYAQDPREGPYTAPRAINVRSVDPFERRGRGGNRPGLVDFVATDFGTTITGMCKVSYTDADGSLQRDLVVIADGTISIIQGASVTTSVAYLVDESGNYLVDESGNTLIETSTVASVNPVGDTDAFNLVEYGGKVYLASTYPKSIDPASGSVVVIANAPTGSKLIGVFKHRLVLADGNTIMFSKQDDFEDWDYADVPSGVGAAQYGITGEAGAVGDALTCYLGYKDEHYIVGTTDTLWVFNGDPSSHKPERVSLDVGIITQRAACFTPDGTLVFVGRDGLYTWQVGSQSEPKPFSPYVAPEELRDLSVTTNNISMQYDHKNKGIFLFVTPDSGAGEHFWLDLRHKALWPMAFGNNNHQPLAVATLGQSGDSAVLVGCKDGYIREFANSSATDGTTGSTTAVTSDLLVGPVKLGGGVSKDGALEKLVAELAQSSGTVNWRIITADTAEEAVDNAVSDIEAGTTTNVKRSGTFTAGYSKIKYPKVRGAWACVWLNSTARWSLEAVKLFIEKLGRLK